jgi:hypothetical protein
VTDAASPPVPRRPRSRRLARATGWTLAVLLVVAGAAAALLPGYLKSVAVTQIREQLHRDAVIESISVNPLLLSVRVKALAINDAGGKSSLLKFDELYTRIGLRSVLRGAPVIEELTIVRPQIHLARLAEARYNISDIVELLLAGPPDPKGPRFALNSLSVTDAELVFDDRPAGKIHKVQNLRINLPALSAFEDERGQFAEPSVSATINGQPLELKGRTKPFDASLETIVDLHLSNVDLPRYLGYSPVPLPVRVDRGRLSTALDIAVVRRQDKTLSATVKGTVRLDDVVLREIDAAPSAGPVAVLHALDAKIGELKWPQNSLRLDAVAIDGPQVWVRRERDGSINWQNMLARAAAAPPERPPPQSSPQQSSPQQPAPPQPSPPFRFAIADGSIADGIVLFDDFAAPAGAFRTVLRPIVLRARNLSNAENAEASVEASLVTDGDEHVQHAGTLRLAPLAATGEVSVKRARLARYQPYFGDVLAADLDGLGDVDARYAVGPDGSVKIADGRITGTALSLKDKSRGDIVKIGTLALTGAEVDLDQRTIATGAIALRQCRLALMRDQAGKLNVASLVKTAGAAPASNPPAAPKPATQSTASSASKSAGPTPSGAAPAGTEWAVSVRQASLERCAVQFDDLGAAPGTTARIVLDPIDVRVENWSTRTDSRARIDLRTRVNGSGQVAAKGIAGATPLAADLDITVDGLDLVPLQPYAADRLNIRVTSGAASTRGKLTLGGSPLAIRYRGDAGLARLASTTKADGEDFLNWSMLQAKGIDVAINAPAAAATVPLAVALDDLALADFYSRLIVNADGTLNVQHVARDAGDPAASSAAAAGATAPAASAPANPAASASQSAPPPLTINRVTLTAGRVNFSDRFIKPNYSANIAHVSGTVTGLSSDFASRANVDIRGRYDPSAPVEIRGTINPLRGNLFLDIAASCRDVELAQFTPYSQKYAGYGITKGKLSLNVKYLIEDRKLTADNSLLLDQLTFGDKVESPDATKLPVLFAVSLLKNSKGEIDLNLPVSGSLDDPQFSVFAIVLKIIGNLLVKAATSPFALIGAIVGGSGEDLAFVDFPAGVGDAVASGEQDKLAKIAKALNDRPALHLDIRGRTDPVADADALVRRLLVRKLAAQRPDSAVATSDASGAADAGGSGEAMTIPTAEYQALLKRVFENEKLAQPKPAAGPAREVPPAEMESLLLANIKVTPDDLRELGEHRANAAKSALIKLGVAGERMYIVTSADNAEAKRAPRVDFVLK